MAKIKVYELAKEVGVPSKEVLAYLNDHNIDVTSHMSAVEEDVADQVRKAFSEEKKPEKEAEKEAEEAPVKKKAAEKTKDAAVKAAAKETPKAETKEAPKEEPKKKPKEASAPKEAEQEAPKKKKIVQVFRPQNTQNGPRRPRRQGEGRPAASQGKPMQVNNGRPSRKPAPQPEKPAAAEGVRKTVKTAPAGTHPVREAAKPVKEKAAAEKPAQERPVKTTRTAAAEGTTVKKSAVHPEQKKESAQSTAKGQTEREHTGERTETRRREERGAGRTEDRREERGGERRENRRDDRREDRREDRNKNRRNVNAAVPPSEAPAQKPSRGKGKGKDDHHNKKDYRHDEEEHMPKGRKSKGGSDMQMQKPQSKPKKKEEEIKSIVVPEQITIQDLADLMKVTPAALIKKMFLKGEVYTVNQEVDYETAENIALEYDILCEKEEKVDVIEELLKEDEEDTSKMVKRPPVVCVMGHVDHGKTSLLDAVRHTNVIEGEAGGITQHIGASVVNVNGQTITFLDTPGHEAFTAMRMRGANSTDIAVLVVAADDGIMPQTIEAINHAKAAGVEIVVAINKIDKPGANVERVKQELTEYELVAEDWGGSTVVVPVSAKTGEGLEELMEMILLTADVMELKADPDRRARGLVLEARLDKGRGPVATVLVQKGTLRVGDSVAAGSAHGKVRAMMDDKGKRVKEAGPSVPVEILGLNDVPDAGEVFVACENEKEARNFAETFISENKVKLLDETKSKLSLDDLFDQIQEGSLKELNIIVKADVQGSVEALKSSLEKLSNDEVVVKTIHGGVGAINESDVDLASASNAVIIGFNVRIDPTAKETADREGVDVRNYNVIYKAIEDVEAALKGMLEPVYKEQVIGHAEIRQLFKASSVGNIAGSYVLDGVFERGCRTRITRDGKQIFDGALASLKRFQDDVKEVKAGYECGLVFENFNDIKVGDQVEAYKMVEVPR